MTSRRPNDFQEDQLIKRYLQRRVIITHVTTDYEDDFHFIRGVSFAEWWRPVRFECRDDGDYIELYRDDVRWDFGPAGNDPRLAYLRKKVNRAIGKYDTSLDSTPLQFSQRLELAAGFVALGVLGWGLIELIRWIMFG